MLVDVNGKICELIKAEAKGGNYHRRVPRASGKGYTYYYDEDKYAASRNAHLDGQATRAARLNKAVLGAVDGAGAKGCAIKSLRAMAKKEGKEHVAAAIKSCLEKGDLTYKSGMLYRKAMRKAKLEIEATSNTKTKSTSAKKGKDESEEKPLKKGVRWEPDHLRKAKGPIGIGKRGGKIYGYDAKGKPIYKPSDVPEKPSKTRKKKPAAPSAQLSLFGQTKLEKPKLEPKPETKLVPDKGKAGLTPREIKQKPVKDAEVGSFFKVIRAGGFTLDFQKVSPNEVILVAKNNYPVPPEIGGRRRPLGSVLALIDYDQDVVTVEGPKEAPTRELTPLAKKMVRVRELIDTEYPGATQEQREDLYRKMTDALAGRPGSDIDAAIAEAEALLAKPKEIEHVEEKPKETPATIEVEQEKHEMTLGERLEEYVREGVRESALRERAAMGYADAQEELAEYERTRGAPRVTTEAELEEMKKLWEALPRSGPGWQLITKPWSKQKLKRDVESTVGKIEKLPEGSIVRVTGPTGKVTEWKRVAGDKLSLVGLEKETPIPVKYALPGLGGNVLAQVEVKAAKEPGEKLPEVEPVEHPPQEGASGLPEIPPKPATPPRIPRNEFRSEMKRRQAEGLTPRGNTYAIKDEIKELGGVWDSYDKKWLLPSQEAVDYIEAVLAHKQADQAGEVDKAVSEGRVVSGRTWDVRGQIKNAGGYWHGPTKQWIMPDKESAEMMQDLVERTTTGSHGSLGGKPTERQMRVASDMMQRVSLERWKRTKWGAQGLEPARVRAMLPDMSMLEVSDLISTMKGEK